MIRTQDRPRHTAPAGHYGLHSNPGNFVILLAILRASSISLRHCRRQLSQANARKSLARSIKFMGVGCLLGRRADKTQENRWFQRVCGKLGKLGTSQDFLLAVTFWASGGGASFAF
jgi:hypothetical protein